MPVGKGNVWIPDQPDMPIIGLRIGGFETSYNPSEHLQSLEVEVITNSANKYKLTLYDANFIEIEEALFRNDYKFDVRFGWAKSKMFSPWFSATAYSVNHSFVPSGVMLEIEGTSVFVPEVKASKRTKIYKGTPTEVMKEIGDQGGFEIEAPDFVPIPEKLGLRTTSPGPKVWRQNDQDDLQFLAEEVLPACETPAGETGYRTYVDDRDGESKIVVYRPDFDSNAAIRDYVFARDPNGVVLEFSPEMPPLMLLYQKGGGAGAVNQSVIIDPESGKDNVVIEEVGDGSLKKNEAGPKTVGPSPRENLPSKVVSYPFVTAKEQRIFMKNMYNTLNDAVFPATLTVIGDPRADLYIGKYINIFVYLGGIHAASNTPHYTSGMYYISKLAHQVSAGKFTTTFGLHRSSQSKGTRGN